MISSPTTDQLILDCCRELLEEVLPSVQDETAQVRLHMVETVLRAAAVRAAHEIAWMREETAEMLGFAGTVAAQLGGSPDRQPIEQEVSVDSLHLDDVAAAYRRASDAFSAAMEVARLAGDSVLAQEAIRLLDLRVGNERSVCGGWLSTAGR